MIQVLNNILYYLNLAALLHYHQDSINNGSNLTSLIYHHGDENVTVPHSPPPVLVKQIPPGPILPGIVVKFVCAVNGSSICGTTTAQNEVSYQWEMYRYTEDQNGNSNCTTVVKLPGQDAEVEIKFNETDPKTSCDLVCTINRNQTAASPSSASIKLHFLKHDNQHVTRLVPPAPPSNFKILDITSRAAYFAWHPPRYIKSNDDSGAYYPEITGYVIEYKNGRGINSDWQSDKVARYNIKDGSTVAACVSGLLPWTTYHFRIISFSNNNVSSTPSPALIVRTAEEVPSAAPIAVKVEATTDKTLQVSWKPPPKTAWNGALLGYNIGMKKASSDEDEPYAIFMHHPLEALGSLYSYQIKVADSTVEYKVVVQAFNNLGSGPFSEPVTQRQPVKSS